MQWILAHVGITENEIGDALAKEARQLNTNRVTEVTRSDISSVAKAKLIDRKIKIKHQIPEISTNRILNSTLNKTHNRKLQEDEDT